MEALEYFRSEKDRHIKFAQEIVDRADSEGRNLNEEELALVKDHTARAQEFGKKIQDAEENAALRESIAKLGASMTMEVEQPDASNARTPGEAFTASEGYRALLAAGISGRWRTGQIEFLGAAGDPVLESTGSNADAIFSQDLPGLKTPGLLQETPSLAGLFSQGVATSNTIKYVIATTRNAPTNAVTAEGSDKPGAEFAFNDATENLEKLAAFIPISEEMMEDSPAIRDYINAQLPFMIRQAEDFKLATEVYDAADGTGLSADIGGSNGFDAIAAGINDVQTNAFVDPDGLFINPVDWWSLKVEKDGVNGGYYSGGPYIAGAGNPWGLRVVVSQRAPVGFPLVGNFRQGGQVWRKGGIRLEASNSHEDYFQKNLVAIRAEERVALTVYYPEMFSVVNLAS